MEFGSFFALMPGDNAATIAVAPAAGHNVLFPQDGPASGIARSSAGEFTLPTTGDYEVSFQVSITEAGQLAVALNDVIVASTVAGRATGTSQIANTVMVAASAGDVLSIINPAGNSTALTVTPIAGGASSVSAWVVIKRVA